MPTTTPRFKLPLLESGQAQKEIAHNQALIILDSAALACVEGSAANPPANPALGMAWRVLPAPTGAWAQHSGEIATWQEGGWTFLAPTPGYIAWDRSAAAHIVFDGGDWRTDGWPVRKIKVSGKQVVGERQAAIGSPAGGAVVDAEARAAITALLAAVRAHGLIEL